MRTRLRIIEWSVVFIVVLGAILGAASEPRAEASAGAPAALPGKAADAISAGYDNTCGITAGAAWCQGLSGYGQLGNNNATGSSLVPVAVSGMPSGVTGIAVGALHACAVQSGGVWCWGFNAYGQLGNNSINASPVPVAVSGLGSGFVAVSAGLNHTCAVTSAGALWCWGANGSGQLGDGTQNESHVPVAVSGMTTGVTAVSAGQYFTCAIKNGAAWCWGANNFGQLGDNSQFQRLLAVQVSGLSSGVTMVSAGGRHTCAAQNGSAWCWGTGQMGNNNSTPALVPVQPQGLTSGVTAVGAGDDYGAISFGFSCAVKSAALYCWGDDRVGQVGIRPAGTTATPVPVPDLASGVTALSVGYYHACALSGANGASCWGLNEDGQVGNSTSDSCYYGYPRACSLTPVPVASPPPAAGVSMISSGWYFACAVKNGGAWCWGRSPYAALNFNDPNLGTKVAQAVQGLGSGVTAISAGGGSHVCAVQNRAALCWGYNTLGQLGNNSIDASIMPVMPVGLDAGVTAVTAGGYGNLGGHSCALKAGAAYCWGGNQFGQLGNGTTAESHVPVAVSGMSTGVTAIAAGAQHTCAVKDGGVWCWGMSQFGQAGTGAADTCSATACSKSPVPVPGMTSGVTAIGAGDYETCAVKNGGAWCWGYNYWGELGNGLPGNSATPVQVSGLTSGVSSISVGYGRACAVQSGGAWCWGNNAGRLGNGSLTSSSVPVQMTGLASGVADVSTGQEATCALTTTGVVSCTGSDNYGSLGDNGTATDPLCPNPLVNRCSTVPVLVQGLPLYPLLPGPDSDHDGCADVRESALVPATDANNPWDFYSVPVPALINAANPTTVFRDKVVSAGDAQAVFVYFKVLAKTGSTEYEQDLNQNGIKDGIEYDRTSAGTAKSGPPDGVVSAQDAQLAFAQFKLLYAC